ncbi:MAG: RNA polymerase factor sigma-54 [Gemmataceae bacterium]|nr:RNA polymerase factor sigma-54 [Gemmataceae bacterium]
MEMGQGMHQRQELRMSPRMYQSMEILQMPVMDLQERIQQEMNENPVLDLEQSESKAEAAVDDYSPDEHPVDGPDPGNKELVVDAEGSGELDFDRLDALSKDWGDAFNEEHRPSRGGMDEEGDRKHDAMQNMASRPESLQEYLVEQLGYLDLPAEQAKLVKHVITYIDDVGYLSVIDEADPEFRSMMEKKDYEPSRPFRRRTPDLGEIANSFASAVAVDEVEEALAIVQELDPPGVGARDLRECLLLQMTPDLPHRELVRKLVQDHLEDIPHNRLPAIEKATGADIPTIKEAIEVVRRLNPKPGAAFAAESIPYVVPDLEVERNERGEYEVKLLDDWLPTVYISPRYIELYKELAKEARQEKAAKADEADDGAPAPPPEKKPDEKEGMREYLRKRIQSAQWLQESIEQRRSTLKKVTSAIIEHQRAFLEKGPEFIQPLKMQQIADQVGVHVTTVSRAVDDKWVQTPRGIFPLKRFFGGGKTVAGEEVAYEVMKQRLLEIIEAEDKRNPLSDEELVERMNGAGYPVKRRTITKYRQLAHIPSSRERKEWAS